MLSVSEDEAAECSRKTLQRADAMRHRGTGYSWFHYAIGVTALDEATVLVNWWSAVQCVEWCA